jgi:hypothetical protein
MKVVRLAPCPLGIVLAVGLLTPLPASAGTPAESCSPPPPSYRAQEAETVDPADPADTKTRYTIGPGLSPVLALLFGAHWAGEESGLTFDLGIHIPLMLRRCLTPRSGPERDISCADLPQTGIDFGLGLTSRIGYSYSAEPGTRHLATTGLGISVGWPNAFLTPFADLVVGSLAGEFAVGVRGGVSLALFFCLAMEVSYESLSPAGPGGGPELRVTGGVNVLPVLAMLLVLFTH